MKKRRGRGTEGGRTENAACGKDRGGRGGNRGGRGRGVTGEVGRRGGEGRGGRGAEEAWGAGARVGARCTSKAGCGVFGAQAAATLGSQESRAPAWGCVTTTH